MENGESNGEENNGGEMKWRLAAWRRNESISENVAKSRRHRCNEKQRDIEAYQAVSGGKINENHAKIEWLAKKNNESGEEIAASA